MQFIPFELILQVVYGTLVFKLNDKYSFLRSLSKEDCVLYNKNIFFIIKYGKDAHVNNLHQIFVATNFNEFVHKDGRSTLFFFFFR